MRNNNNFDFDIWLYPKCGYFISDIAMKAFRLDFGCPVCKISFAKSVFLNLF